MIAFFDTSVYIDLFAGLLTTSTLAERFGHHIVRVSPIVLHELYRGVRTKLAKRIVDRVSNQLLRIEPPSWAGAWITSGHLLPRLFPDHESLGLARLQNDFLLALTSRGQGALLVTRDQHFTNIRKHLAFHFTVI